MWRIDRDYCQIEGMKSRVGVGSGKPTGEPKVRIRLLTDDRDVIYGGWSDQIESGDEMDAFAPLDFAAADAGCTILQYRNESGEWETL